MPLQLLFKSRLRIGLDLLLLAAAAAALVFLVIKPGHHDDSGSVPVPSPAQVASTQQWLAHLPLPAGTRVDATGTACGFAADLCLVTDLSQAKLVSGLDAAFRGDGASVTLHAAGGAACDSLGCLIPVSYRGVRFAIAVHPVRGYRGATMSAMIDIPGSPVDAPAVQPVPTLAALRVLPMGVETTLHCRTALAHGCSTYAGSLRGSGNLTTIISRWQMTLESRGWRASPARCSGRGASEKCNFLAERSLAAQGRRIVTVIVQLDQLTTGRLTGKLELLSV